MALDGRGCDRPGTVDRDLYIILNAYHEPLNFVIPSSPTGRAWRRTVDTALPSPEDALGLDEGPVIPLMHSYRVEARSTVILVSQQD
jgi:glycogen operon protein